MVSPLTLLTRLHVAVETGRLPRDVGAWAVGVCAEHVPATERRVARDRHLRAAAELIPGSTVWAKARGLERAIVAARGGYPGMGGRAIVDPAATSALREHVRQAIRLDPDMPISLRQLVRVLTSRS
jgi:hypothetical protein